MQPINRYLSLPLLASTLLLGACGSSSSSSSKPNQVEEPSKQAFSEQREWQVTLNNKDHQRFCYDFVSDQEGVDEQCSTGTEWGLIIDNERTPKFWSNGGVTNTNAKGAAFGFFSWDDVSQWQSGTHNQHGDDISHHYAEDSASGVFSGEVNTPDSWFAYDLEGTHQIYPNYNVYLLTANKGDPQATQYALQITGYYGGPTGTQSGYVSMRWIDTTNPDSVLTAELDATDADAWIYYDLANKTVVDAPNANNWHIAFKRTDVMLNGGDAGGGQVAGYIAQRMDGLYTDNKPNKEKVLALADTGETLSALLAVDNHDVPSANDWISDANNSVLNPSYKQTGAYGQTPWYMDFGLFIYNPNGIQDGNGSFVTPKHGLSPNQLNVAVDQDRTEALGAALLRSGDGSSYARFKVTDIQYAEKLDEQGNVERDENGNAVLDNNGSHTWTFYFDVQIAQ